MRPEREMDNFLCSHRCTSYVRLWLGARSVLVAPTRPATSLRLSCGLAPSTLALSKVMFLVLLNLGDVLCSPTPMFTAIHSELFRGRNLSSSLPSEQGHPVNSDLPRSFLRRVRLHLCYTPITYVVSSPKSYEHKMTARVHVAARKNIPIRPPTRRIRIRGQPLC